MQMAQPTLMAPPQLGGKQRRQQPRQPLRDPPQVADGCALISSYEWNYNKNINLLKIYWIKFPIDCLNLCQSVLYHLPQNAALSLFEKHAARD